MTHLIVADVMTRNIVAVRETAAYKDIASALATRRVSAVPVIDADTHVLGVVSEADLLPKLEFHEDSPRRRLMEGRSRRTARHKAVADRAADLMSSPAITVQPNASVVEAARRMDSYAVKRLPVVDELGRLVGIVSRADLIRVFLRPDDAIRDEVVNGVLRRTLWVAPGEVEVRIRDGVVTLTGEVERRGMIDIAVRLTRAIDGVVDVVNQLTTSYDDTLERNLEALARPRRGGSTEQG